MEICGCYCVWNEEETIAISMRSILPLVDRFLIIDGKFKGYPEGLPVNSTDRTVEIAKTFPNVEVIQLKEPLIQCEVRDMYAETGADWNIDMAGHQIMFGDVKRLRHELAYNRPFVSVDIPVYARVQDLITGKTYRRCRMWHRNCGYHYGNHHWMRLDKNGQTLEGRGFYADFVYILTLHELRSLERKKLKDAHLLWRSAHPNERW